MKKRSSQGRALMPGARRSNGVFRGSLEEAVLAMRPVRPLYAVFPEVVKNGAKALLGTFPGQALYAVKANPDATMLSALGEAGVTCFDVASLAEIERVRRLMPKAQLHFMHPIKAHEDIRIAYFRHAVRHFSLDHEDELFKIMRATDLAQDLNLTVRVALPKNDSALIDFSEKFGATPQAAAKLMKQCRTVALGLGLSFHVGTQTTDAAAYGRAVRQCAAIARTSGVRLDMLNVGGGFPVAYAGDESICTLEDCVRDIMQTISDERLSGITLLAEPGRLLCAPGVKLVARVELRKGDLLYLNDGVYGGLYDGAGWVGTRHPVSAISCDRAYDGEMRPFRLAGPTCDSLDMMAGPYMLPNDIGMGDWIVFGNMGAYSQGLRSNFNGFGHADAIRIIPPGETG